MDLFNQEPTFPIDLLPHDGDVRYYGKIYNPIEADHFYKRLLGNIPWKHDEAYMFGKKIITKRKIAWHGSEAFPYRYSNTTKYALPWTDELLQIKEKVEALSEETYNSCLLNLYHDGSEGMAWHSDGEKELKKHGAIASLSFGAERKFAFKNKATKETISLVLEHGSMLIMAGTTQENWLHRLPPTKKVHRPRVNLTFRTIDKQH